MDKNLENLNPKLVWRYFKEICEIPHPSKHEEALQEYFLKVGKSLGLETIKSEIGNIIIRKKATPGMENKKCITFQGHMDMVAAKLPESNHNFLTDPIDAHIDGDIVKASNTTLGADNGIGVAFGLAILASSDIKHGPLELFITVDEETGMTGVFNLDDVKLKGDILLNLDSEDDNEVCIGCAGGINANITIDIENENLASNYTNFSLNFTGGISGHSGGDVHEGRANAIKEIAFCLYNLYKKFNITLSNIEAGELRNVIPGNCEAIFSIENSKISKLKEYVCYYNSLLKSEYQFIEKNIEITIKENNSTSTISKNISKNIILALNSCFNGMYKFNFPVNVTEASSNIGAIHTKDNKVELVILTRSANKFTKEKLINSIAATFELINAKVDINGGYPGWSPNPKSDILNTIKSSYKKLFNKEIIVGATHGGLECGIIIGKFTNMSAISIGPTIKEPHTGNEFIYIKSVKKVWDFLLDILENSPE